MKTIAGRLGAFLTTVMMVGLASTAHATMTMTWDFSGNAPNAHERTFVSTTGLGMDVTAWSNGDNFATAGTARDIRQNSSGIGVDGCGSAQIDNDCTGLDPYAEWIALAAPTYGWSNLNLGINALNSGDLFTIFGSSTADLDPSGTRTGFGNFGNVGPNPDFYDLSTLAPGLENWAYILVGVTTNAVFPADSDFRILSLEAYVPEHEAPEPGTLMLIGIGLAGLGLARRRGQTA